MRRSEQNSDIGESIPPRARTKDVVVREFGNELLVYDLRTDKAHHLNESAALVWKNCDGFTTTNGLIQVLELNLGKGINDELVGLALKDLNNADLLEVGYTKYLGPEISRRKVIKKYASLAAVLPVVMSLVAPPAAFAQSCLMAGEPCVPTGTPCCPGLACEGSTCA